MQSGKIFSLLTRPPKMNKNPKTPDAFSWLKDLPSEQNAERFAAEQMVACDACRRKNAPNRAACLYCGAVLQNAAKVKMRSVLRRRLEEWEKGFNVAVLLEEENPRQQQLDARQIADFLRLEQNEVEKILQQKTTIPVARAETLDQAEAVTAFFNEKGFQTRIIADADLQIDEQPRRVRAIEFGGSYFNLFLYGKRTEPVCLFYAEIELVVFGTLFERRLENRERHKGRNDSEICESREITSDETIFDFYVHKDSIGYRICARSFDFSCLGADKRLLASENFRLLREKLADKLLHARFDDSYSSLRDALNAVWRLAERSESRGWQREGIGKIAVENRLTISNAAQFLRYSRFLRRLEMSG
jgi:hypothetical protein